MFGNWQVSGILDGHFIFARIVYTLLISIDKVPVFVLKLRLFGLTNNRKFKFVIFFELGSVLLESFYIIGPLVLCKCLSLFQLMDFLNSRCNSFIGISKTKRTFPLVC